MAEPQSPPVGVVERFFTVRAFFLIVAAVVVLDQATKAAAIVGLAEGRVVEIIPRLLQLIHRTNTGAAWSMFADRPLVLTLFASCVALGLTVWSLRLKADELMLRIPLGMILGGALGNLIDRYRLGHVIDFIDAHWDDVYHFPTFNVADSAICIGMGLLILMNLRVSSEASDVREKNGAA